MAYMGLIIRHPKYSDNIARNNTYSGRKSLELWYQLFALVLNPLQHKKKYIEEMSEL